jgi:hypothetical protein
VCDVTAGVAAHPLLRCCLVIAQMHPWMWVLPWICTDVHVCAAEGCMFLGPESQRVTCCLTGFYLYRCTVVKEEGVATSCLLVAHFVVGCVRHLWCQAALVAVRRKNSL